MACDGTQRPENTENATHVAYGSPSGSYPAGSSTKITNSPQGLLRTSRSV